MRRFVATLAALTLGCAVPAFLASPGSALAAPEPDPVPKRWELNIVPGPLRVASVDVGAGPRAYFYFTYTVTNNTGQDLLFAPSFELATDEGHLITAGREVPLGVVPRIQQRLGDPFLLDQVAVLGNLLQGRENARQGLVVWPVPDMKVDEVTIYARGFSGEFKTLEVPLGPGGEIVRIVLSKQLMLRFSTPGHIPADTAEPLNLIERRWIMR